MSRYAMSVLTRWGLRVSAKSPAPLHSTNQTRHSIPTPTTAYKEAGTEVILHDLSKANVETGWAGAPMSDPWTVSVSGYFKSQPKNANYYICLDCSTKHVNNHFRIMRFKYESKNNFRTIATNYVSKRESQINVLYLVRCKVSSSARSIGMLWLILPLTTVK